MAASTLVVGQYVWAKLTGFPHWPAKILELSKTDDQHYVEFLGQKKTVAHAKVKPITTDGYDRIVRDGKRAKGQTFVKSVNELKRTVPPEMAEDLWPEYQACSVAQAKKNVSKTLQQDAGTFESNSFAAGAPSSASSSLASSPLSSSSSATSLVAVAVTRNNGGASNATMAKSMSARKSTNARSSGSATQSSSSGAGVSTSPTLATSPSQASASASSNQSTKSSSADAALHIPKPRKGSLKRAGVLPTARVVERTGQQAAHIKFAAKSDVALITPLPKKRAVDLSDGGVPPPKLPKTVPADSTSKLPSNPTTTHCNYGFIGLGIMGTEMARNLLKNSHNVVIWNRSGLRKHSELLSCGGQVASSPGEVVDRSDIIFTCVSTPQAARDVLTRSGGVLQAMRPGKGYVDMSTVDAETSQFVSKAIHEKGGQFLEAPVSGSKKPAQTGQLVILTAGDQDLFDRATPAFRAMGKSHYYLGEVGDAARMKLVVNMMMGSMTSALCEGMALAKEVGLSQKMLYQVLREGALDSKLVEVKGAAILKGDFPPSFPLKHQQKDMRLALALGDQIRQPLPVAAAANETFKKALQMGLGDDDMSGVYKAHYTPLTDRTMPHQRGNSAVSPPLL
ncbi:cytokine-like nuclear factor N-PAC [Sycon ciliatum]|uniref:cytokine-like nuclear factor N-PAC n=1 Tax=Sycon ciliatum TaxID=27933 RepID=UPI0020AD94F5|eukprot:scpid40651/ scgid12456/ Putative oxidoreductase GLYR1; Glyoxylate reductase 1 homolog; Nuclear protein NP60